MLQGVALKLFIFLYCQTIRVFHRIENDWWGTQASIFLFVIFVIIVYKVFFFVGSERTGPLADEQRARRERSTGRLHTQRAAPFTAVR